MIERQGGDRAVVDDYSRLPSVQGGSSCLATATAFVTRHERRKRSACATNLLG